jgi:hypothetical protein
VSIDYEVWFKPDICALGFMWDREEFLIMLGPVLLYFCWGSMRDDEARLK